MAQTQNTAATAEMPRRLQTIADTSDVAADIANDPQRRQKSPREPRS
jgi:hypothetical protein